MSTDAAAIAGVRAALESAENAADPDAAAALFTEDIVMMVPDFAIQDGRAACLAFMRDVMGWLSAGFNRHITYLSDEIVVSGDVGFDRGTFAFTVTPKGGGQTERVTGKYLWILRRAPASEWQVARLIVCRDESPAQGSEADARAAAC